MDSQFVPYELAAKLKELGFDEPCLALYKRDGSELATLDFIDYEGLKGSKNNDLTGYWYNTAAPLWQQAFDWVRKEHGLWSFIDISPNNEFFYTIKFDKKYNKPDFFSGWFETWENARLGCLSRLIKLCE